MKFKFNCEIESLLFDLKIIYLNFIYKCEKDLNTNDNIHKQLSYLKLQPKYMENRKLKKKEENKNIVDTET